MTVINGVVRLGLFKKNILQRFKIYVNIVSNYVSKFNKLVPIEIISFLVNNNVKSHIRKRGY